jgi:hypothetical protein
MNAKAVKEIGHVVSQLHVPPTKHVGLRNSDKIVIFVK